jgi:type VI secretion system ImpC/EvpB family protein
MNPQSQYQTRYAEPEAPPGAGSLLDAVLAATATAIADAPTDRRADGPTGRLDRFLREPDPVAAVRLWLGDVPGRWRGDVRRRLAQILNRDVARLDELLCAQVNAILHHPEFQKLEAAWRGLWFLVGGVPDGANVKIRVLNATWKELARDQERALEFDQSQLFRKVYNEEFGMPGGEPYGLLVGNYELTHRPFPDHPTDDVAALRGISGVAAAAFAPFVTGIDPRFLELDSFSDLELPIDVGRSFDQPDYLKWRQYRDTEDARFSALALPRVLYRRPYGDAPGHTHGFDFREDTADPARRGYLWGSPVFALAAVAVRAFAETGWLADVRGNRADHTGGRVVGLPRLGYGSGSAETPRSVADAHLTDVREKELSDLGFVPLCHTPGAAEAAFYTTPTAQKPKGFDDPIAAANARLSAMLHYVLCASRFAHFLKVIMRDRVGAFTTPSDVEDVLNRWLVQYVVSNDGASDEMKARYPLREGRAQVAEIDGKPGAYRCTVYLRPHFQLDQLSAGIRLTTQLTTPAGG